jgi:hypothetical protein
MRQLKMLRARLTSLWRRRQKALVSVPPAVVVALLTSCADAPNSRALTSSSYYLAGNAARGLNANGQFVLAGAPGGVTMTEADARVLAAAYVNTYGGRQARRYAREAQAPVETENLTPCHRAFYGSSSFGDPGEIASVQLRRWVGDKWFVQLCDGAVPRVLVSVSTRPGELQREGRLLRGRTDQVFRSFGIAGGTDWSSPEDAAEFVARKTGERVVEVPELILAPPPAASRQAMWSVTVASPVRVVAASGSWNTRVLLVGPNGTERLSLYSNDPHAEPLVIRDVGETDAKGKPVQLSAKPGRSRSLRAVEVAK